jgi:hypothetical protein
MGVPPLARSLPGLVAITAAASLVTNLVLNGGHVDEPVKAVLLGAAVGVIVWLLPWPRAPK